MTYHAFFSKNKICAVNFVDCYSRDWCFKGKASHEINVIAFNVRFGR